MVDFFFGVCRAEFINSATSDKEALNCAQALQTITHCQRRNCSCNQGQTARKDLNCPNPDRCFKQAKKLIDLLPPKWNPLEPSCPRTKMKEQTELEQTQ